MLNRVGESRLLLEDSYAAIEKDCTDSLIMEVSDDSGKVGTDTVLLHGCPQSCLQNPVEGLLEVYEDMVEVLLVLEIFLTENAYVEDLLCGTSSSQYQYSSL